MTMLNGWAWIAVGATLMGLSARTSAVPVAVWLALALMLRGSRALPASVAAGATVVALMIAMTTGLRGVVPAAGSLFVVIAAGISVAMTTPFAFDRMLSARVPAWASTLVFPAAWITAEFVASRLGAYGTNGSIAYTQAGDLPLIQLCAATGIWGISFLVAWFAPVANLAWDDGVRSMPAVVYVCVLAGVLLAGALRVTFARDPTLMRAAVVSLPADLFEPGELTSIYEGRVGDASSDALHERVAALEDRFLSDTVREARAGARLVAWPEMNAIVWRRDERAFVARAARTARAESIYLAMGIALVEPGAKPPTENRIVLIDPSGRVVFSYAKSRPVPGWEASILRPGDGRLPVADTPDGRFAAAICFENDFPDFVRAIGRARADLWILPANDWAAIKRSHFEMAAFRAVENGTPIVRAGSHGLSGAFDRYGRVLATTDHFTGARTMIAEVPVGGIRTIYAFAGDWFAWMCLGSLALASMVATLSRHAVP